MTPQRICIVAFLFAFSSSIPAMSQLPFMQYRYGYGGGALFMTDEYTYGIAGFVNVFPVPQFGLGVDYVFTDFWDVDLSLSRVSPYCLITVLPQTELLPLAMSLEVGYAYGFVNSDVFGFYGVDVTAQGIRGGINLFSDIEVAPSLGVIPTANFTYVYSESTARDGFGNSLRSTDSSTSFTFTLTLSARPTPTFYFAVIPAIGVAGGELTPSIGIGLGFNGYLPQKAASRTSRQQAYRRQSIDDDWFFEEPEPLTALPNVRKAIPSASRFTDEEILARFRAKYPRLQKLTDQELIILLEERYRPKNK